MTKVQIAAPRSMEKKLWLWLQEQEVLHLTSVNKPSEPEEAQLSPNTEKALAQIQFMLEFITRIKKELGIDDRKGWRDIFVGKPVATLPRLNQSVASMDIEKLSAQAHKVSDELADIEVRRQNIKERLNRISPWQQLNIKGQDLAGTDRVRYELITVSLQEDILVKRLLQAVPTLVLREVRRVAEKKKGCIYLELVVHRKYGKELDDILENTSADRVSLEVPDDITLAKYVMRQKEEKGNLDKRCRELFRNAKLWFKMERELKFAYDALLHRQERYLAKQRAAVMPRAVVISGWIPAYIMPQLREKMERELGAVDMREIKRLKEETPPVAFHNSSAVKPFETITNIYGKPKYSELDPSAVLSLFFLVAFGLALTDAGYGLVMMLIMWAAEKWLRLKREARKMVRLLFYAGGATTIFGALTGGWFGINLEALPASELRNTLLSMKVIDPVNQPLTLLLVIFSIGIVQLLFAWAIRAYDHARKKDYAAAIFDDLAWISMVVLILLWVASSRGLAFTEGHNILAGGVLFNAGVLVLTGGRGYKNPLLKLGGGVLSLYGLVGFLSDTLSYSRLLALGLATGIIALVVNMLGSMVAGAVPGIGWLLAVVVLLVGHVFNLGINALGAFIHSGRLQFVEFFPKFIEGGGVPYKPLGRISKYVDNPKEYNCW